MKEAAIYYEDLYAEHTTIRRPASKKARNEGGNPWRTAATRYSRPLSTVILEDSVKQDLVVDIEKYLRPESRKWYSQRGIPYRRGYLFHGVPGTGKTSLAFALAGYLDLDIYCVSLAEPSISEQDLVTLFDKLPNQCVVLLEDIDSAGLKKRDTKIILGIDDDDYEDDTDAAQGAERSVLGPRISLSGLPNVVDGVASHEGRILIMTTNDVDALDKALLRPERVDVQVKFGPASTANAHDLFLQTFTNYAGDSIDETIKVTDSLAEQAKQFSLQIPDGRFTPAELQGYLLSWKDNPPEDAVGNVKA